MNLMRPDRISTSVYKEICTNATSSLKYTRNTSAMIFKYFTQVNLTSLVQRLVTLATVTMTHFVTQFFFLMRIFCLFLLQSLYVIRKTKTMVGQMVVYVNFPRNEGEGVQPPPPPT